MQRKKWTKVLISIIFLSFIGLNSSITGVAKESNSTEIDGKWKGIYYATQGQTSLTLTIKNKQATFSFGPTKKNPSIPKGKYIAAIKYNEKKATFTLDSKNGKWINRPSDYIFVDFKGVLNKNNQLVGFVDDSSNRFTLSSAITKKTKSKPALNGKWKGYYYNASGKKDLMLTFDNSKGKFIFSDNNFNKKSGLYGSYHIKVSSNTNNFVTIKQKKWIVEPSAYRMIDGVGVVSKKGWFIGQFDNNSSFDFEVRKK